MTKAISRILAFAVVAAVLSFPMSMAASQDKDKDDAQPHMQAALDALKQAKQHLQEAAHDKAGHRAAALKATDEAIRHVEMGMKAGAANEEKHEHAKGGDKDHDHDHDKK